MKERGVRGYSGKRKVELIVMLQASNPPSRASPQSQTWKPIRHPHPTRPPPLSPVIPPPTLPIRQSKRVAERAPNTKRRIKRLGKKERNLESQIRNNTKLREKLSEKLRERLKEPSPESIPSESKIKLIEDQTHVETYRVTVNLNHDVSKMITCVSGDASYL